MLLYIGRIIMFHAWEGRTIMLPCMGRIIIVHYMGRMFMVMFVGRKDNHGPKDAHGPVHGKDDYSTVHDDEGHSRSEG